MRPWLAERRLPLLVGAAILSLVAARAFAVSRTEVPSPVGQGSASATFGGERATDALEGPEGQVAGADGGAPVAAAPEQASPPAQQQTAAPPMPTPDEMHRRTTEVYNRRSFRHTRGVPEMTEADALRWWTPRPLWGHGADRTAVSRRMWFPSATDGVLQDPSAGEGNLYELHVGNRGPDELSLAHLIAAGGSAVNSQVWRHPPSFDYMESRPALVLGRDAKITRMTMAKHGIDAWDVWWNEPGPNGWTVTTHALVGTAHYSEDDAIAFANSLKRL